MSSRFRLAPALLLAASPWLVAGCSKPSGDTAGPSATALTPPSPSQATELAPSTGPNARPVLTPEDAEDAAEHRITEQNLESELDRLEREIQAE